MMAEARERPRAGLLHPDAAADEKYDVGLPGTVVEEEYEDDNGRVLTEEPDGYSWVCSECRDRRWVLESNSTDCRAPRRCT